MGVTNAAVDHILNVEFASGTQVSTWYLGVISGAGTPVLRATDTMASHPGWFEAIHRDLFGNFNRSGWAAGPGPSFTPPFADGAYGAPGNTIPFEDPAVVYGLFLASSYPQGSTSGVLFATLAFAGGSRSVEVGDAVDAKFWIVVA